MGQGATNKRKGSTAERYYAKFFREELGFTFCKTSRQSNRMLDDAGIDLNFLPFNVQIKAGYNGGLNEFSTLKIIRDRLPELFPPHDMVHQQPNILIHKKDSPKGRRRNEYDELVFFVDTRTNLTSLFPYFPLTLFSENIENKVGQKRGWSFEEILSNSENGVMRYSSKEGETLIVMSFIKFCELLKKYK